MINISCKSNVCMVVPFILVPSLQRGLHVHCIMSTLLKNHIPPGIHFNPFMAEAVII